MIYIITGNVGSGKTLTAIKDIVDKDIYAITNFKMKNYRNYYRLRYSDIIIKGEKTKDSKINWEFWENLREEKKNFSIFLDEAHNFISSRSSMSSQNKLFSKWVSQIRKIFSDDENNHIFLITQYIKKIDVNFRDMAFGIILCKKRIFKNKTWISQNVYDGLDRYEYGKKAFSKVFLANPYFRYYNTKEMITFGDDEEYV